jgi:hypothetical protein
MLVLKHIYILISAGVLDFLWAIYIKKVAQSKPIGASVTTVFIYGIGGLVTISYVNDHWLLLSATIGATIATYLTTRYVK